MAPRQIRLPPALLPVPGWPRKNTPRLVVSPASIHANGSTQTTSPHIMCRPNGTPTLGDPEPAVNGNRPHAWTVVAWYSAAASTCSTREGLRVAVPDVVFIVAGPGKRGGRR